MKYSIIIYFLLVFLTLFAFILGYRSIINYVFVIILLITTFIKAQLVIDYFMGLKNVALKYRVIPTLWLSIVLSLIGVAYYY